MVICMALEMLSGYITAVYKVHIITNAKWWECHIQSLISTRLCHYSTKAATNNMYMNMYACIPIKLDEHWNLNCMYFSCIKKHYFPFVKTIFKSVKSFFDLKETIGSKSSLLTPDLLFSSITLLFGSFSLMKLYSYDVWKITSWPAFWIFT